MYYHELTKRNPEQPVQSCRAIKYWIWIWISLYCDGVGWALEGAIKLVWRHAHRLLSLESPETLLKVSALHSLWLSVSKETQVHICWTKLDIIWIATAHCSQNTFKVKHILAFVGLVFDSKKDIMNMLLFSPLSLLGFLCLGEGYWIYFEASFSIFLRSYLQKPGHLSELLLYEVTESQSDTHGSFQQQWLYDWHCSTEYSEHTFQGNPHNQHFAHSEI